jgi:hypothetical protein
MGIFWYQRMGKYKQQIHSIYSGFAQRAWFPTQKHKGFSIFIKEIFIWCTFYHFHFLTIFQPKSNQQVLMLRSRRFFWHQYWHFRLMSYFDVICVIWCHMHHLMSNDTYDIKIWRKSISPILVSKEASIPQWSHLLIQFWLNNSF